MHWPAKPSGTVPLVGPQFADRLPPLYNALVCKLARRMVQLIGPQKISHAMV